MEFLKRSWAQLWAQLERLSFAERALIVALLVILVGVLAVALHLASKPQTVAVPYAVGRIEDGVGLLRRYGIDAEVKNGQLVVPVAKQYDAIARLTEADLINDNSAEAFASLVESSPWETNEQLRRRYYTSLQTYLSNVTGRINGVRKANVIISMPEQKGFGATRTRPSASVMIELEGSRGKVDQELVASIASLVSGAVAEMTPQDVSVIDSRGRAHKIGDPDEQLPTEMIELVRSQEAYHRKKIEEYLSIPDAIVAVAVTTSPIRKEMREQTEYMPREPIIEETTRETTTREMDRSAEPGVRPNTGADITSGGSVGREHTEAETQSRFGEKKPTTFSRQEIAGHQLEQINVTINIPRSYFVNIHKARTPDAAAPDDAALQPIIDAELASIRDKVTPLIATTEQQGAVKASMYYDQEYLMPMVVESTGGVVALVSGPIGGYAALGALGVVALGLMLYLVRRTTQEESLPTVEELAGVPQALPADEDLVGEADEVENTLAGVELDESTLRSRKISEQISDMIKASPQEAGSLLNKWVAVDD